MGKEETGNWDLEKAFVLPVYIVIKGRESVHACAVASALQGQSSRDGESDGRY